MTKVKLSIKDPLKQEHDLFAKYYSDSFDSLDSYKKSHKELMIGEAEKLLCDDQIWLKVISTSIEKEFVVHPSIQLIAKEFVRIQKQNINPIEVYNSLIPKSNKVKIVDPVKSIGKLSSVFHFYSLLPCEVFIEKIKELIRIEVGFLNHLLQKAPRLQKDVLDLRQNLIDGPISFDDILTRCNTSIEYEA
ncbi:MAG: hypothetical protein IPL23_19555 [Saprospiraceae bacterium]|nr:hypothetical protein [Saprospiraceae bacterium]MBK8635042.1 hypothetical protein [Saprospiraceae bacterium]